tara:strand:+ start:186 stop:422 length:237 start_codon:yes stop_codon:yes gene_type:complete
MKVGDLVKRNMFALELGLTREEEKEFGIIIGFADKYGQPSDLETMIATGAKPLALVQWSFSGIMWDDPNDLEVLSGSR